MAKVTGLTAQKMLEIEGEANEAKNVAQSAVISTERARDLAVSAAEQSEVSNASAQSASTSSSMSAASALASAERAEAAAGGVDMDVINLRLAAMDSNIANKANLVSGKIPFAEVPTTQTATENTIPSRGAGGRLLGIGTPTTSTDAATKAYVDQMMNVLDADLADFENSLASKQDLMMTTRLDATVDGADVATNSIECAFLAAPVDMEITAVVLTFDDPIHISGTTNSVNVRIVHRANSAASGINIVQLSSTQQPIGGSGESHRRKAWNMKNGNWNTAANRIVPAGDVISLVLGSPVGSFRFTFPVIITIMWRPI